MKREMDLIRAVVLAAESGNPNGSITGYTDEQVRYHRALAIEANLLKGRVHKPSTYLTDIPDDVVILGITYDGHDFIDAIREDSKWDQVKQLLLEAGKQITIETIKYAVKQLFGFPPA